MKKNYIKPEIVIGFIELESLLAASEQIAMPLGDDVENATADTKEHNGFDVWE